MRDDGEAGLSLPGQEPVLELGDVLEPTGVLTDADKERAYRTARLAELSLKDAGL